MDHHVVVIGGGPAGAVAARQLAAAGRRVALLERQRFPRFHIGESLLPASNELLRRIGVEDEVQRASFVVKRGASFSTEDGERSSYIDFTACPEVTSPVTYQVLRSRFDHILLDHAIRAGAEVHQECRALDATFRDHGVSIAAVDQDGTERTFEAAVVIDASGQAGFLPKRLGLRETDPALRNVALYAHYEGIPQPPGERSGDIRIVSRRDLGWIWFIPVSATVTSVGFVMSKAQHAARGTATPEELLERCLASTEAAAREMQDARRVSPARFEADFCYTSRAYAGDRWLLAGDAGSFLDPVFSTGVLLALESGEEAAVAVERALSSGSVSARAFARFQRIQRRRYRFFRRFARGFYDPTFRDLLIQPSNRFGLVDALVAILAGNWRPSLRTRLRIELFFALAVVQRHVPLAPRSHGVPAEAASS